MPFGVVLILLGQLSTAEQQHLTPASSRRRILCRYAAKYPEKLFVVAAVGARLSFEEIGYVNDKISVLSALRQPRELCLEPLHPSYEEC
jgi:hypothetical protein